MSRVGVLRDSHVCLPVTCLPENIYLHCRMLITPLTHFPPVKLLVSRYYKFKQIFNLTLTFYRLSLIMIYFTLLFMSCGLFSLHTTFGSHVVMWEIIHVHGDILHVTVQLPKSFTNIFFGIQLCLFLGFSTM